MAIPPKGAGVDGLPGWASAGRLNKKRLITMTKVAGRVMLNRLN